MFHSLNTSSSVVRIKSTVNIQIVTGLLQFESIVKSTYKNFYLTTFMVINTKIINKSVTTFYIYY